MGGDRSSSSLVATWRLPASHFVLCRSERGQALNSVVKRISFPPRCAVWLSPALRRHFHVGRCRTRWWHGVARFAQAFKVKCNPVAHRPLYGFAGGSSRDTAGGGTGRSLFHFGCRAVDIGATEGEYHDPPQPHSLDRSRPAASTRRPLHAGIRDWAWRNGYGVPCARPETQPERRRQSPEP